jgi:hypothetical protein
MTMSITDMRHAKSAFVSTLLLLTACAAETPPPVAGETQQKVLGCFPDGTEGDYAVCLCDNFVDVGLLTLRQNVEGHPASIGVNGRSYVKNLSYVEGSWISYGGFDEAVASTVRDDQVTSEDLTWTGALKVGGDLVVGGKLRGVGGLKVGGALKVGGSSTVVGLKSIGSVGSYASSAPQAPPCGCDSNSIFDVAKAVEFAKKNSDNATVGFSPEGMVEVGISEMKLTSGRYYIKDLTQIGNIRLNIEGNVAIFVSDSVKSIGNEHFSVAHGSSLDLYVAGSVASVGNVGYGNLMEPGLFRLFVGGAAPILVNVGNQKFSGHIYAPTAEVTYVGNTVIRGSIFAERLHGLGNLVVEYTGPTKTPDETCCQDPGAK